MKHEETKQEKGKKQEKKAEQSSWLAKKAKKSHPASKGGEDADTKDSD